MPDMDGNAVPLAGIRVVDLADNKAAYCSKLLADLGAEVIRVDGWQDGPSNCEGPYLDNIPGRGHSLFDWYNNSGKLSIALDLTAAGDRQQFLHLIKSSDLLIESYQPGYLERLSLGFEALKDINPGLSVVSVSGFGRGGPYSAYKSNDIIASASGGQMYVCGRPGKPPLKPFGNQSYYLVSLLGATGAMLALRVREQTGCGQHVDLSLQESVASALEHVLVQYMHDGVVAQRQGSLQWNCSSDLVSCRDGYVLMTFNREWEALVELLDQQKMAADLTHSAWKNEDFRKQHIDDIEEVLTIWTCQRNKGDIFHLGQAMRFPWAVLNGIEDVVKNEQLKSRGFFVPAQHPLAGREFLVPRPVINFNNAPTYAWKKAPSAGEHNSELETLLAGTGKDNKAQRGAKTPVRLPLEGTTVLDFTWMLAGPYATRMLADFGAEVIKVQSKLTATGAENNETGYFAAWNRNKLGITLDMSHPEARGLALELVSKSDVVIENFTPRVMDNWGLNYLNLLKVKPGLVMVSLSGFGRTGPWRDYAALGPTVQALSGLTSLTSYDRGCPNGIGLAYADHISGLYAALAVLAALRRRDMTGEGACIDISEYEAACSLLGPALMDYSLNGQIAVPAGNRSEGRAAASQGCYRCKGEDRWCVISVSTDEEWQSLCRVMHDDELAGREKFSSLPARLENYEELDEVIEKWTSNYPPHKVMKMLQEAGVPAAAVSDARDLARDPALEERDFFVEMEHSKLGKITADANPIKLSDTPARYHKAAPLLGEDNRHVFIDLLGMDVDKYEACIKDGIIA
jgi:crotonobetainyl-CoA:carnitine CoA-transferase CaiB-like acyl-CoA transferase